MTLRQSYNWQIMGGAKDVSRLVTALEEREMPWCLIGGLAVNHWARQSMATADVDLVIASGKIEEAPDTLKEMGFADNRLDGSINFKGGSTVSIQISAEEMYLYFPSRAVTADATRRPSKLQKDLADIARLTEAHPELSPLLPSAVAERLKH